MSQSLLNIEGVLSASIDAGIKSNDASDLSIIHLIEGSTTAAVFTQNVFCAAPVLVAKNHLNTTLKLYSLIVVMPMRARAHKEWKTHYTLVRA